MACAQSRSDFLVNTMFQGLSMFHSCSLLMFVTAQCYQCSVGILSDFSEASGQLSILRLITNRAAVSALCLTQWTPALFSNECAP